MTTLPGTIPGLLRRCSPVVHVTLTRVPVPNGKPVPCRGTWHPCGPKGDEGLVCWDRSFGSKPRVEFPVYAGLLRLDLDDPTGQAHAAWWVRDNFESPEWFPHRDLLHGAMRGRLPPAGRSELRDYVLMLSGTPHAKAWQS